MRDEQLKAIREKCIAANPEIVEQHSVDCDMDKSHGWILKHHTCVLDHEPRLADVLLAAVKSFKELSRDYILAPIVKDSLEDKKIDAALIEIVRKLNLRKDNLTEQSDETISFIYELLK